MRRSSEKKDSKRKTRSPSKATRHSKQAKAPKREPMFLGIPPPPGEEVPPGATRKAFDRPMDPGGGPPGSASGGIEAAGTPLGGTEVGGLGGTTIGDGAPINTDMDRIEESDFPQNKDIDEDDFERDIPLADIPVFVRGLRTSTPDVPPGTSHRGDSTIGSDPEGRPRRKKPPRKRRKKS
jgi:hypothetical protein